MKAKTVQVRLSDKRYDKLKAVAKIRERTVTQLVEDWIDRLPDPNKER